MYANGRPGHESQSRRKEIVVAQDAIKQAILAFEPLDQLFLKETVKSSAAEGKMRRAKALALDAKKDVLEAIAKLQEAKRQHVADLKPRRDTLLGKRMRPQQETHGSQ